MGNLLSKYNLLILIITILIYVIVETIFKKIIKKNNNLVNIFLANVSKILVLIFGLVIFLIQFPQFEKVLNALISNSALIVATLGFVLQSTLKNILAGVMLLSSDTFKLGDRIEIPEKNLIGTIRDLTLRHTTIELATHEMAIVPNSLLNEAIVINNDVINNYVGYPLVLKIKIGSDIHLAKKIIEEALERNRNIINKTESKVTISHIEIDSVELKVLVWTRNIEDSFQEITNLKLEILRDFKLQNILC